MSHDLLEKENSSSKERRLKGYENADYYMGPRQLSCDDLKELAIITCR